MIAATDPFMADVPTRRPGDFERTVKGVPLVADPNGTLTKPKRKSDPGHIKRVMYRRPSGFGKQIENTYNLQKWGERQEALGFALDFNLLKQAAALLDGDRDSKDWKDQADQVVVAAKQTAKAWIAADRGTHGHGLAEDDDEGRDIIGRIEHGEMLGLEPDVQHALVEAWREMLERTGMEILAVEFACVNDTYKAAGTGDRIAKLTKPQTFRMITGELITLPADIVLVLDIKTGKRRTETNGVVMYWQSYAVQVAIYAGGCLYDPDTDTRSPYPWPVDQDWALIAHLDVLGAMEGTPSCELVLVDLRAGRRAADLCVAARDWENDATVFSVAQVVGVDEASAGLPIPAVPESAKAIRLPTPDSGTPSQDVGDTAGMTPLDLSGGGSSLVSAVEDGIPSGHVVAVGLVFDAGMELKNEASPHAYSTTDLAPPSQGAALEAATVVAGEEPDSTGEGVATSSPAAPSQGADLSDPEYELLWQKLRHEHDALPHDAREWVNTLSRQAMQAGCSFHTRRVQTERSYHIAKTLVTLAATGWANDDILEALLLSIAPPGRYKNLGHRLGSLDHAQAERLATLADQWAAPPPTAA